MKVPPRPEVIRERYADFLRKNLVFIENYKRRIQGRPGAEREKRKEG